MSRASIRDERDPTCNVFDARAELGDPNDVRDEVGARFAFENFLFDFERPSKAKPSSRAGEYEDADFFRVSIESRSQRRRVTIERRETHFRGVASKAPAQYEAAAGEKKRPPSQRSAHSCKRP